MKENDTFKCGQNNGHKKQEDPRLTQMDFANKTKQKCETKNMNNQEKQTLAVKDGSLRLCLEDLEGH